jgi:basic membrane protein A and related proteins
VKFTRRNFAIVASALVALTIGGFGSPAISQDGPLKVAFVYVGPIGDAGWTFSHDLGRKAVEEKFGDKVETSFIESVPEGPESERVFEDLARRGNKVIFGTSFGYMDQMANVAKKFPDTIFVNATGFKTGPNLGTYMIMADQARYLEGMVAGAMSESGQIGFVAAFPIPEVLRHVNAFTLGARSIKPDAEVRLVWTSTWYDPSVERQAAESLVAAGVDVLAQYQDSPATGQVAEEAGIKWTGFNADMSRFAPKAWLTGTTWNWGTIYVKIVGDVIDGKWTPEPIYGTMAEDTMALAPFGEAVPEDLRSKVAAKEQEIRSGAFNPFTGPIRDQKGNVVVPEGKSATLKELLETNYLVEGVQGSIPQ